MMDSAGSIELVPWKPRKLGRAELVKSTIRCQTVLIPNLDIRECTSPAFTNGTCTELEAFFSIKLFHFLS